MLNFGRKWRDSEKVDEEGKKSEPQHGESGHF